MSSAVLSSPSVELPGAARTARAAADYLMLRITGGTEADLA